MRHKLLNILTVCLVTLAVLSPELLVFSVVWEQHLDLVETQQSYCEIKETGFEDKNQSSQNICLEKPGLYLNQAAAVEKFSDVNFVDQLLDFGKQYKIVYILQRLLLFLILLVGVAAILYDRYLIYRAAIFKQQVEMLERVWRQSIEK